MRKPLYDPAALRKTVSVTVNGDLVARAKAEKLNISRIAEDALAAALLAKRRETLKEEARRDMDAYNDYIERYGSPTQALRDYLGRRDDAV